MTNSAPLNRIVLELAREPGHPEGDANDRYVIVAPLHADGRLDGEAWKAVHAPAAARALTYETAGAEASLGHLVHGPGGRWILTFDITNDRPDETGFRFEIEPFVSGEYVSIERGDETHVFRVVTAARA